MKMTAFEKHFVNAATHSRSVAHAAVRRLHDLPVPEGGSYLDVGCGNGAAALAVASAYRLDVTGIDLDSGQIALARTASRGTPGVHFLEGDATALPFPDAVFDLVASNKTTHHIADWRRAIEEMLRVLKPGGHLVYSDLALPAWLAPFVPRVPSRSGLDTLAQAHRLHTMRRRARGLVYEAFWEKGSCRDVGGRVVLRDEGKVGNLGRVAQRLATPAASDAFRRYPS